MADLEADERALAGYADALAAAADAVIEDWVVRCVVQILGAYRDGAPIEAEVMARAHDAGARARAAVAVDLRALLDSDIDEQRATPLSVLRGAVRFPTEVLERAGVPPIVRDEFDERAFPSDIYGLAPATFADVDPSLHEPGLEWGAAKAHVHLARRRGAGRP